MADEYTNFNAPRIRENQIIELKGLCRGMVADGHINHAEAEELQKWLVANASKCENPFLSDLLKHVDTILADGVLDQTEADELFKILKGKVGPDFELGEPFKTSTEFFDHPPPEITFREKVFCFTGNFGRGNRAKHQEEVKTRGGVVADRLVQSVNYLVVAEYATDSWLNSDCGNKLILANEYKKKGLPIFVVKLQHWQKYL